MTDTPDMERVDAMFAAQRQGNRQRKRERVRHTFGVLLATVVALAAGLAFAHLFHQATKSSAENRAAYIEEIADVEERFNTEYEERIQLEVYNLSGSRASYARTIVAVNGTIRPDCVLWRTSKTAAWTLKCDDAPQPTRTLN